MTADHFIVDSNAKNLVIGMERLLLIDTDAGVDDAIAIFLCLSAHKNPETKLTIVGITCVSGNTYVDNVCINVTRILNAAKVEDVINFH